MNEIKKSVYIKHKKWHFIVYESFSKAFSCYFIYAKEGKACQAAQEMRKMCGGKSGVDIEQRRESLQLVAEGVERAKAFFSLADEVFVVFEMTEAKRIVDVQNGDAVLLERLSPEHVFVAVVLKALVERMVDENLSTGEEVAGVEIVIGMLATLGRCVVKFVGYFIAVAQVM